MNSDQPNASKNIQNVNLFSKDMLPKRQYLNARDIMLGWGVFVVVLASISFWDLSNRQALLDSRNKLRSQLETISESTVSMLRSESGTTNEALQQEVKQLSKQRNQAMRLLSILRQNGNFESEGFSGYLRDLAAHNVEGLWLTKIHLKRGGAQIEIQGKTLDASHVPRFLQELSRGGKFQGHKFAQFEISSSDSTVLEFSMQGPVDSALNKGHDS